MLRASHYLYFDGVDRLALAPPDWDWCHDPFCPEPSKTEVAPERPVLKLDESGLEIPPRAAPTVEDAEQRVGRARRWLIASSVIFAAGAGVVTGTVIAWRKGVELDSIVGVGFGAAMGAMMVVGGLVGMPLSGARFRARKEDLRDLQEANKPLSHRIRWEPRTSRAVF
jgi:hypothetical protein